MPSHFEAARGAYVMRDFTPGSRAAARSSSRARSSTANLVKVLPQLDERGLNVQDRGVHLSPQLFAHAGRGLPRATTSLGRPLGRHGHHQPRVARLMRDWIDGPIARDYSLSSDWDDRWRTGGTVDEVIDEAHLGPDHILDAIQRFAAERDRASSPPARRGRCHRRRQVGLRCPSCAPTPTSTSDRAARRTCRSRKQPPPARHAPPDLRLLIYVGIALAAVLAALFTPYLIAYLLQAMNGG